MTKGEWAAYIFAVVGHGLDWYTTKRAVLDTDIGLKEGNPVMRWLIEATNQPEIVMAAAKFGFLFLLWKLQMPVGVVWAFGALGLFAAWHNRRLIHRARGTR